MRVLLDSHAVLWFFGADPRLGMDARRTLESPQTLSFLSVCSLWELTLKVAKGKLKLPAAPEAYFSEAIERYGLGVVPIDSRHIYALYRLAGVQADPFDRMLVAQAQIEGLTLLTADPKLSAYPVKTIPAWS